MRLFDVLFGSSRKAPQPAEDLILMVVGMHRSGTSFLTGSLQGAGLELGKHSTWNPHNLKGNRENGDIVAFHDALLAARGHAWDNPPSVMPVWTQAEYAAARELIKDYDGVKRWGFKDPRALLAVTGWQELIPQLRFVGIFRHPSAVADSLQARGGMPREQALGLWKAYNSRLLELHGRVKFPVLCFDQDEENLHRQLDNVMRRFGLQPPAAERFFSSELKHHRHGDEKLSPELDAMYQALKAIAD
ncbi:sulfotransferase family protein [Pseudomonas nicosulfuronedens]